MKVSELFESASPVPKLSSLWKYSDEFSPEVNARARAAAEREIESIRAGNKKGASDRKTASKEFVQKDLSEFGFPEGYLKEYAADMLKFTKSQPKYAAEYFRDMSKITADNLMRELFKHARSDGVSDSDIAYEILMNPGTNLEKKYKSAIDGLEKYMIQVNALTPKPRKAALDAIESQMVKFVTKK